MTYFSYDAKNNGKKLVDVNHLRVFVILIAFNIGAVTAYKYYEEYKTGIESKYGHTIALRTWGCKVEVEKLKVQFIDSNGVWKEIPQSNLFKEESWSGGIWKAKSDIVTDEPITLIKKSNIVLKNSGIVLMPDEINNGYGSEDIQIQAKIKLSEIDSGVLSADAPHNTIYTIQFCMDVPISDDYSDIPDLYNSLEFFFSDFTLVKARNPILNIDNFSGSVFRTGSGHLKSGAIEIIDDIENNILRNETPKKINKDKSILLSAKMLKGKFIFNISSEQNNYSKILYRGSGIF